jgi:hypothetical protein
MLTVIVAVLVEGRGLIPRKVTMDDAQVQRLVTAIYGSVRRDTSNHCKDLTDDRVSEGQWQLRLDRRTGKLPGTEEVQKRGWHFQ